MKKFIVVFVLLSIFLSACSKDTSSNKIQVITTVYPLEYLASNIAGDKMDVRSIYPKGGDIHSYELTAKDIEDILNADLFIGISENLEPFIKTLKQSVNKGQSDVKIIEVAKDNKLLNSIDDKDFLSKKQNTLKDYHIWTSPKKDLFINEIIYDAILSLDSNNKDYYLNNFNSNKKILQKIDKEYESFENKKTVYVSHDAYYWLREDYNMNIIGVNGVDHHDEASSKDIEKILDDINDNNIKFIYSNLDDKNNKTIKLISNEANIEIDYLSDLEVKIDEVDFFKALENNLNSIKKIDM